MKKALFFACVLIGAIIFLTLAYLSETKAEDQAAAAPAATPTAAPALSTGDIPYETSPFNKLGRGAINVASCVAEVPFEMFKVSKEKDPVVGCTLGLLQGVFNAFARGVTGIVDIVTFPIPPYNKPLMEPEYVFKSTDEMVKDKAW